MAIGFVLGQDVAPRKSPSLLGVGIEGEGLARGAALNPTGAVIAITPEVDVVGGIGNTREIDGTESTASDIVDLPVHELGMPIGGSIVCIPCPVRRPAHGGSHLIPVIVDQAPRGGAEDAAGVATRTVRRRRTPIRVIPIDLRHRWQTS